VRAEAGRAEARDGVMPVRAAAAARRAAATEGGSGRRGSEESGAGTGLGAVGKGERVSAEASGEASLASGARACE